MNKIIFESDEQAIETAMIMFACSYFKPWTKEEIIKRLRKANMIKTKTDKRICKKDNKECTGYVCNKSLGCMDHEQPENKLISDNRDRILEVMLYHFYLQNKRHWETFEMYLNRILKKDK